MCVWLGKCVGVTYVPKGGSWDQVVEVVGKQDLLMLPASIPYGSGIQAHGTIYEDRENEVKETSPYGYN